MSRRRLAGRSAVLVAALGMVVGCSGSGDGSTRDDEAIRLVLFGDPVETAGYEELVEAFEEENPDVDMVLSPVAEQDDLMAKLTTQFASGRPPDLFLVNYRNYGQFAASDVLAPVQPLLDRSAAIEEDDFAPAALDAFRFDGEELTCMPQNVSSLVTYYNADLFEAAGVPLPRPGWTWDAFLSAAKALTGGGRYGVGTEASLIRVAPFVWSAGGEVVDDSIDPTRLMLDTGAARRGLDFFLDLQTVHGVAPPDREEQSQDSESRFLSGTLGMYLNSRKSVPTLRTIEDFTWDVAPLPVAPGGEPATILHGDAYCLADTERQDDAWRFVEFASSVEGQQILARSGRTVPSRTDVAESAAFLRPDEPPAQGRVFTDVVPTIRSVPHTASWARVESEVDAILTELYYGRLEREEGIDLLLETTGPLFVGPGQ
jgi:multiple sugar transport system substrate-binding protein